MHKNLINILLVILGIASVEKSCLAEEVTKPEIIRLPGISHVWGVDTKGMPTITFEELENCMSSDASLRQQFDHVQLETKLINEEVLKAEKIVEENQKVRTSLEKEATDVQLEITAMNTLNENFSKRKQELSALTSKKVDAPTAKKINQQVEQFNKDIIKFNADSATLKEKTEQLKSRQKNFNESLDSLKIQLDQLNAKTAFNEQKKSFDATLVSYKDKCSGTRKLEQ
jgi:chromosome segregation ATPase